jgi:hypothetical protein
MDDASYKAALNKAFEDWADLTAQERAIAFRKAQLQETIVALSALCSELPDINALSLSDAIRLMISSTAEGLSTLGLRDRLTEMGFDLTKHKNPLASIHTAVNRMIESGELRRKPSDEANEQKVEAGENLKTPALPETAPFGVNQEFWNTMIKTLTEGQQKK